MNTTLSRLLAFFLALSLSLPTPAHALRGMQRANSQSGLEELSDRLLEGQSQQRLTGLEEVDPQVKQLLSELVAQAEPTQRLSLLAERLPSFTSQQRIAFFDSLPWLEPTVVGQLLAGAFLDETLPARTARDQILQAIREDKTGDALLVFEMLLKNFPDEKRAQFEATLDTILNTDSRWTTIATGSLLSASMAILEALIRETEVKAQSQPSDPEPYQVMAELVRAKASGYLSFGNDLLNGVARMEMGYYALSSAIAAELLLRRGIQRGAQPGPLLAAELRQQRLDLEPEVQKTYHNFRRGYDTALTLRPSPILVLRTLEEVARLEELYGTYLTLSPTLGGEEALRHLNQAQDFRKQRRELIRERQLALGISGPATAGLEELETAIRTLQHSRDPQERLATMQSLFELLASPSPGSFGMESRFDLVPKIEQLTHLYLDLLEHPGEGGEKMQKQADSGLKRLARDFPSTLPSIFRGLASLKNKGADAQRQGDAESERSFHELANQLENSLADAGADMPYENDDFQRLLGFTQPVLPSLLFNKTIDDIQEAANLYGLPIEPEDYLDLNLKTELYIGNAAKGADNLAEIRNDPLRSQKARAMKLLWQELVRESTAIQSKYGPNPQPQPVQEIVEMTELLRQYVKLTEMLLAGDKTNNIGNLGSLLFGEDEALRLRAGRWLLWLSFFGNKMAQRALDSQISVRAQAKQEWDRQNRELDSQYGIAHDAAPPEGLPPAISKAVQVERLSRYTAGLEEGRGRLLDYLGRYQETLPLLRDPDRITDAVEYLPDLAVRIQEAGYSEGKMLLIPQGPAAPEAFLDSPLLTVYVQPEWEATAGKNLREGLGFWFKLVEDPSKARVLVGDARFKEEMQAGLLAGKQTFLVVDERTAPAVNAHVLSRLHAQGVLTAGRVLYLYVDFEDRTAAFA